MVPSRRQFLQASALAFAGSFGSRVATGGGGSVDPSVDEWPMARYDPAGTGHHPTASGPKADVEIAWTHDAPEWFLGTAPPIRRGETLHIAGNGLLALDSETGERQFGHPGPYGSAPARVRSSVYETDTLAVTASSGVFGLNASGGLRIPLLGERFGVERWGGSQSPRPSFFGPADSATPVTADGTIYTAIPGANAVAALDPDDGGVRWRNTHHEDDAASAEFNRPAVRDGLVFVTNWPRQATAYRAETGERHWQRELDEQMVLAPVATDAGVVVQTRNGVQLLDTADGSTLWSRDLDANAVESAPAVADGTIFAADEQESLHALDLRTGEPRWTTPFDGPTSPVVADGVVYAVRSQVALVAVDAESGEQLFEYEPSEVPLSAPVVGDGVLYATNRRRVIALEEAR